ncbi:MAG: DUF4286 family protein [Planctomycetota bacterium]|nr:DUF4286 family protein [Planctomycetota bacterium]
MFVYSIDCEFEQGGTGVESDLVHRWVVWMREVHIPDVIASGARSAEFFQFEREQPTFRVLYHFDSARAFNRYENEHAPRLRAESLREFPSKTGLSYRRECGESLGRFS